MQYKTTWASVKNGLQSIRKAFSRIASILFGRAFVGLPLSRDEDWIEATVNYTGDVCRAWMVPIVASFLPQVKSFWKQGSTNVENLAPLLAAKHTGKKSEKDGPGGEMIDWFMSQYRQPPTAEQLGRERLLATFGSGYNLSNALSHVPCVLAAADPQDIKELREEAA